MKKSLIAILIVALMLFASCDSQILEIMEKMGQNLVPETPEVTVTVGDEKPEVTEDGILNKVPSLASDTYSHPPRRCRDSTCHRSLQA